MSESRFQRALIGEIRRQFPGAICLKNDANHIQGFPDWTVLYERNWCVLEIKDSRKSPIRPNQQHYISLLNKMSYANFVYPENFQEVIDELQLVFHGDHE